MTKHKRGFVREDGKILIKRNRNKEIYGTPEQLEQIRKKERDYTANLRNKNQNQKKWKIGELNTENNLYFIRNSGSLKPIWGTYQQVQLYRQKKQEIKINYMKKINKIIPIQKRKRGDVDPILNLIFWKYNYITGNEIWLTKEKFNRYTNKERISK